MIDKIFPETLEILNNLIKFQTVSGSSNLELIKYCEKKLEEAGASSFKTFNKSGSQANLFSTIEGVNKSNNAGIILSVILMLFQQFQMNGLMTHIPQHKKMKKFLVEELVI